MKFKLLVADDEYWAREKIRRIIPWEKYSIEFLEPAKSGEEVLARIKSEPPDIFISDINMPGMNGVELMELICSEHPQIISFVISGYDDFSYVKNTMKSGAINYLLKPVTKMDLIAAVTEAMNILTDRREKEKEAEETQSKLRLAASFMQDQEYSKLIEPADDIPGARASVNISLKAAGYGFALIKIHDMRDAMSRYGKDINLLSHTIKQEILASLPGEDMILFNNTSRYNEFILVSRQGESHTEEAASRCVKKLQNLFRSPVTIVLSDYSYSIEDMRNAYTHAVSLMMARKYAPVNAVIAENRIDAEGSAGGGGPCPLLADDDLNSLRHFIKSGNRKMVRAFAADKLKPAGGPPRSYLEIRQAVKQVNALLMDNARPDAKADDVLALENLIDETVRTVEFLDIDAVLHCEEEAIDAAVGSKTFEGDDTMRGIVGQVREYIDGHYFEELSLSSLAERFAAERTYLSKSFKLFVGETLINYIAKKRIEKSIGHIREDKLTLSEISFLVGYYDYAYFSRVFKKIVGVSPSEYKRQVTG